MTTEPAADPTEHPPPDHEARLATLEAMSKSHEERLTRGAEAMQRMQADLATNTETTTAIKADTGEIIEFFDSFKGAFKVFDMLGKLAKPLGYILAQRCTEFDGKSLTAEELLGLPFGEIQPVFEALNAQLRSAYTTRFGIA